MNPRYKAPPVYEDKGDRLSRAASAVMVINRSHAEAAHYDAGFDGGEWSGPAHAEAAAREIEDALAYYGYSPREYNAELNARGVGRFAHFAGLYAEIDYGAEDPYEHDSVYGRAANL